MNRDTEGSMQHVVSFVLRVGVLTSAAVGIVGLIFNAIANRTTSTSYSQFLGTPEADRHVPSIIEGVLHLQPRAIMMFSILLLLLTPITRVAVSLLGFIKEKDRVYVAITSAVLLTLLASLFFGGATE